MKTYKPKDFAKAVGVSVKTLQRWDRAGILKAFRTPTKRRYYTQEQLIECQKASATPARVVIYARAYEDEAELKRQLETLREEAATRGFDVVGEYSEMGSGYEFCRPQFCKLLKDSKKGIFDTIFISNPVSLTGFGYSEFVNRLENLGVVVYSLDDKSSVKTVDACHDFEDACTELASKLPGITSMLELLSVSNDESTANAE